MTTALLLVAHGSPDPRARLATEALARAVARHADAPVHLGFLDHDNPGVDEAIATASASADHVVLVPLLLSSGFHAEVDVPAAVDRARIRFPRVRFTTATPLGPDVLLTRAVRDRLSEVGVSADDGSWGVVLAAVGSSEPAAADDVASAAALLASGTSWRVLPGFATSAHPTIASSVAQLLASGATRVAVAPYVLFPGRLPDVIAAAEGAAVASGPIGDHPALVRLILARAAMATGHPRPADLEEALA